VFKRQANRQAERASRQRLGTMFVNEIPMPIVRIYLAEGSFILEAETWGPKILPAETEVRIHDRNGELVAVAPYHGRDLYLESSKHSAVIVLPLHVNSVVGWPRTLVDR
jgi:hypothetical protein